MPSVQDIDRRLERLAGQPFRARFHLHGRELAAARTRGARMLQQHAADIIATRLAPAAPREDGKQTPYRGHPVFVAQHATATCCRTCLERWHDIPRGRVLDRDERTYVVEVIGRWIDRELRLAPPPRPRGDGSPAAERPGGRPAG